MMRIVALCCVLLLVAPVLADDLTLTVDTTNDDIGSNIGDGICATADDECTLRAALQEVNANEGSYTINFDIGGGGEQTIAITQTVDDGVGDPDPNPLPEITRTVTIDGTTQPGYTDTPLIILDGAAYAELLEFGVAENGLTLAGDDSVVQGLMVTNFDDNAVAILGNGHQIIDNVLSGNGRGIFIENGENNVIEGNIIGLNAAGDTAFGNGSGIRSCNRAGLPESL